MGYQLIETVTLASAASSIEFTSIPQDGVDLVLKFSLRGDSGSANRNVFAIINGDTGANYSRIWLRGDGITAISDTSQNFSSAYYGAIPAAASTSNTFSNTSVYFSNYTTSTTKVQSIDATQENNTTGEFTSWNFLFAHSHALNTGITSIALNCGGDNFVQHSSASLYKITAD